MMGFLIPSAILSIVSELQDEFDITITPADIVPRTLTQQQPLGEMVCRLKGWITRD